MRSNAIPDFSSYNGGNFFFFGRKVFSCEKVLGSGAYGNVFLFTSRDGEKLAVKCERRYHDRYAFGAYFKAEAEWYQKIHGLGVFSGDLANYTKPHYMLIPYFEGKPLYEVIYYSVKQVFFDWIWTAAAINELHEKHHVIHGDLKTDNIISGKRVYLIDFGFVTRVNTKRGTVFRIDENNSQYHQAPELFTNTNEKQLAKTTQDIYSLGLLLRDLFSIYTENAFLIDDTHSSQTQEVIENLSTRDPSQRWTIAKAIYLLATSFLSTIPRNMWQTSIKIDEKAKNPALFMPFICVMLLNNALQIRIDELTQEKKRLNEKSKGARTKGKKITGLSDLQKELTQLSSSALDVLHKAKQDSDMTAGFFRHKTRDLLEKTQ